MRNTVKQADRLAAIRLRYMHQHPSRGPGHRHPAAISAATGLPAAEVVRLLTRRQWREGDIAALKAIADRLGLDVPLESLGLPMREGKGPMTAVPVPILRGRHAE